MDAISAVPKIMTEGGIIPTAIEFMDRASVKSACEYLNENIPYEDAGAMLLITVDGSDEGQVEREYDAIGEQVLRAGAIEIYVADNYTTSERIWRVRRNLAEAAAVISPHQANEDISVPLDAIPQLVTGIEKLSNKYKVMGFAYGHAGDGNIHARFIKPSDWTVEEFRKRIPDLLAELYELTGKLKGVISGEHGIGHKRKKFLPLVVDAVFIDMMRAVKKALDPNNILNPGKIVDL